MDKKTTDKRNALSALTHGLNAYSAVIAGRAYDAGYDNGKADGAEGAFTAGFQQANRYGSKAFIACTCKALRQLHGFGAKRMQRVCDAIQQNLLTEIDINETIEWCEKEFGLILLDELFTPEDDL